VLFCRPRASGASFRGGGAYKRTAPHSTRIDKGRVLEAAEFGSNSVPAPVRDDQVFPLNVGASLFDLKWAP
jgi:hypothetical protein